MNSNNEMLFSCDKFLQAKNSINECTSRANKVLCEELKKEKVYMFLNMLKDVLHLFNTTDLLMTNKTRANIGYLSTRLSI